jgi:hypothetical protein
MRLKLVSFQGGRSYKLDIKFGVSVIITTMAQTSPYFEFDTDGVPKPCSWELYAKFISAFSHVNRKYSVMALLNSTIEWLKDRKSTACPAIWSNLPEDKFTPEQIMDLKSILAIQILSLATELTENLAAVCYAYAEAVDHGHKYFPLLLRDFGLRKDKWKRKGYDHDNISLDGATAKTFYDDVKKPDRLKRCLGNPLLSNDDLAKFSAKFENLSTFRQRMNRWYNTYKHVHMTVPVHYKGLLHGQLFTWHILHRIPDYLEVNDSQVEFHKSESIPLPKPQVIQEPIENDSFLSALELIPDAKKAGDDVMEIWHYVRKNQHERLFGEILS